MGSRDGPPTRPRKWSSNNHRFGEAADAPSASSRGRPLNSPDRSPHRAYRPTPRAPVPPSPSKVQKSRLVEAPGNVTFDKPGCSRPSDRHIAQCGVTAAAGSVTMRVVGELRVAVGTALRSGRDLRPHRPRAAPRADPSVRDYRTGLLPWVVAAKRCSGQGCRIWGRGSHRSARRLIRSQVSRSCWLRRRSVNSQFRVIWSRKAESALLLSGSGGRGHRSPRLPQIPA